MDELRLMQFENRDIRIFINKNGDPEFCASDVTGILGYVNGRDAILKLCNQKGVAKRDTLTAGGTQSLTYINEGNLYRLAAKSQLPEAIKFESWIFDEVIPTIRKTGKFQTKELSRKELALMVIDAENAKELAEKKVLELQPKAEVFDDIMSSDDCVDIGDAAKVLNLGYGRNRLFEELRTRAILMHNNIPYQYCIDYKYFKCIETRWNDSSKTHVHIKTLVTQKGMNWLLKTLK